MTLRWRGEHEVAAPLARPQPHRPRKGSHVNRFVLPLILSGLVSMTLAACGGEGTATPTADGLQRDESSAAVADTPQAKASATHAGTRPRASAPDRPLPSIDIVDPTNGQAVRGDVLTVSVAVKAFKLVNQQVRPPFPSPVAGQGHVHYYLDTKRLPTTHAPPATGVYRSIPKTAYTWAGVAPGKHSFAVQLVGRDHAPLRPPVTDRITVHVE